MNEYERQECYQLLREIISLDSKLETLLSQKEINELVYYLKNLKEKLYVKYYQTLNNKREE